MATEAKLLRLQGGPSGGHACMNPINTIRSTTTAIRSTTTASPAVLLSQRPGGIPTPFPPARASGRFACCRAAHQQPMPSSSSCCAALYCVLPLLLCCRCCVLSSWHRRHDEHGALARQRARPGLWRWARPACGRPLFTDGQGQGRAERGYRWGPSVGLGGLGGGRPRLEGKPHLAPVERPRTH